MRGVRVTVPYFVTAIFLSEIMFIFPYDVTEQTSNLQRSSISEGVLAVKIFCRECPQETD